MHSLHFLYLIQCILVTHSASIPIIPTTGDPIVSLDKRVVRPETVLHSTIQGGMQMAQQKSVDVALKATEEIIVKKVTGSLALKAASMFASVALGALGGVIAGALLMGIASLFMPPNLTPDEIYDKIWGKIQSQIGTSIAAHASAESQSQIRTLMQNIATITGTLNKSPVPASIVDQLLSVHNSLMSNTVWYQLPGSSDNFVLCGPVNGEKTECLHTGQIRNWAFARVDGEANLDSLNDMTWTINESKELMLSQPGQKYCLAHDGNGQSRNYIAIWNQEDGRCKWRSFKLMENNDKTWSIKDGDDDVCVFTGGKDGPVLVNRNARGGKCQNDGNLRFRYKITIPSNKPGSGGVTGDSTTATQSFGQIGIQMYYFPQLATAHLVALKELHLRSPGDGTYGTLFQQKVKEYKEWIDYYGPIFTSYSDLKGYDPRATMDRVNEFRQQLNNANLNGDQITLNIPVTEMSKLATASKKMIPADGENQNDAVETTPQRRRAQVQPVEEEVTQKNGEPSLTNDILPSGTRKNHRQSIVDDMDNEEMIDPSEIDEAAEQEEDEPLPAQKKQRNVDILPVSASGTRKNHRQSIVDDMDNEEMIDPSEIDEAAEQEEDEPLPTHKKQRSATSQSKKAIDDTEAEDLEEIPRTVRHRQRPTMPTMDHLESDETDFTEDDLEESVSQS